MSTEDTKTLLPSARISLFVNDDSVRANAENLQDDWRYARVGVDVHAGDIETAIEALSKGQTSPDLIVVETPTTDEKLTSRLETLAEYCDEDTAAIVIGPVNDVYLYRTLIGMGVSDYLVPPIDEGEFANIIARILIERYGTAGSRLIAFVGAKGGVGTSALTRAAGQAIANKLDQKVIVLDAAGGWSYLGVATGAEPVTTLRAAVRAARDGDEDGFKRMIHNVNERMSILNSGGDPMLESNFDASNLEALIDRIAGTHPVVLFDASMAPAAAMRTVVARANAILVVSTPNLPSLRSARGLISEIGKLRSSGGDYDGNARQDKRDDLQLVMNMQGANPAYEVAEKDIPDLMGTDVALNVAYNPKAFLAAESRNELIGNLKAGDQVLQAIVPLVRRHVQAGERKRGGDKDNAAAPGLVARFVNWIKQG